MRANRSPLCRESWQHDLRVSGECLYGGAGNGGHRGSQRGDRRARTYSRCRAEADPGKWRGPSRNRHAMVGLPAGGAKTDRLRALWGGYAGRADRQAGGCRGNHRVSRAQWIHDRPDDHLRWRHESERLAGICRNGRRLRIELVGEPKQPGPRQNLRARGPARFGRSRFDLQRPSGSCCPRGVPPPAEGDMDQLIIDFEVLAQVAKTTRTFKANEMIFKTGDHGSEFFVVREGSVGIYVGGRVVERIGTSGVFGEMAMVDALP